MKKVYIASPYAGDVKENVRFARAACRFAIAEGHVPIASHLIYPQMLDDNDPLERAIGLELGLRLIDGCDEFWLCGDTVSSGMKAEKEYADAHGIPTRQLSRMEVLEHREFTGNWPDLAKQAAESGYRIWATVRDEGGAVIEKGLVAQDEKALVFQTVQDAAAFHGDLLNLRMRQNPVVEYRVGPYSSPAGSGQWNLVDVNRLRELETQLDVDSLQFKMTDVEYGTTGGGFYVAAMETRLTGLKKTVWLNAGEDAITVTSVNHVWGQEDEWSKDPQEVGILEIDRATSKPADFGPWAPLLDQLMQTYAGLETQRHGAFCVEPQWLPQKYIDRLEPEHYQELCERAARIQVKDGTVNILYERDTQSQKNEFPLQPANGMEMGM